MEGSRSIRRRGDKKGSRLFIVGSVVVLLWVVGTVFVILHLFNWKRCDLSRSLYILNVWCVVCMDD